MAYTFRGFFTTPADGLIEEAAARWPGASVRAIPEQFNGIGVRLPEPDPRDPVQYQMVMNCDEELPEWSRRYPENTFVYILVDCFGGPCDHLGCACKNGEMVEVVDEEEEPDDGLIRLMSHLGAKLENGYFQPFERNYPW